MAGLGNKEILNAMINAGTGGIEKNRGPRIAGPMFNIGKVNGSDIRQDGYARRPDGTFIDELDASMVVDNVMNDSYNRGLTSGNVLKNPVLVPLFEKAKQKGKIHFMGMLSDGGIHSFQPHLAGLLRMSQEYGIEKIYIHGFLDGRDVGERSAKKYVTDIESLKIGTLASLGGRFYAMDRDTNWDRTKKACDVLWGKVAPTNISGEDAIDAFYNTHTESDYYMPPVLLDADGAISEEDVVVCFNYRSDRMRQLWSVLCDKIFTEFSRPFRLNPQNAAVFGNYSSEAKNAYTLEEPEVPDTLGEVLSDAGLLQLRISETEKFNHVTFYFSGQRMGEFPGEERILIPSPKCSSYAEKPEMSAKEQTETLIKQAKEKDYSLIVQNFANPDLVGHSGDLLAAEKAISVVDSCLAQEIPVLQAQGYDILIFADHGNSDRMIEPDGSACASHTKNKVPCWLLKADGSNPKLKETGTLADIAPTALDLLSLKKPSEITGESLLS